MLKPNRDPNFSSERIHTSQTYGEKSEEPDEARHVVSLPSLKEVNLLFVTTVYTRKDVLFVSTHRKKWNPTGTTSIRKIMLVDTFLRVPPFSGGIFKNLTKFKPYTSICMDIYCYSLCFKAPILRVGIVSRHLMWSCSCRSESTKACWDERWR